MITREQNYRILNAARAYATAIGEGRLALHKARTQPTIDHVKRWEAREIDAVDAYQILCELVDSLTEE